MIRLTQKRKDVMVKFVSTGYFWSALSSEYQDNDEKQFKTTYGMSFKQAEKARQALLEYLRK